jgi:hypothetical protein
MWCCCCQTGSGFLVRLEDVPPALTQLDPTNFPHWAEVLGDDG